MDMCADIPPGVAATLRWGGLRWGGLVCGLHGLHYSTTEAAPSCAAEKACREPASGITTNSAVGRLSVTIDDWGECSAKLSVPYGVLQMRSTTSSVLEVTPRPARTDSSRHKPG
jgi:hypothetical protein